MLVSTILLLAVVLGGGLIGAGTGRRVGGSLLCQFPSEVVRVRDTHNRGLSAMRRPTPPPTPTLSQARPLRNYSCSPSKSSLARSTLPYRVTQLDISIAHGYLASIHPSRGQSRDRAHAPGPPHSQALPSRRLAAFRGRNVSEQDGRSRRRQFAVTSLRQRVSCRRGLACPGSSLRLLALGRHSPSTLSHFNSSAH
jgi:hypothetical protein